MNPQTTDGMAAKNSMTTFSTSRVLRPQNSDTKIAAPKPVGTEMTMASAVTDAVPASSARMPNCGRIVDSGRQFALVKNSLNIECPEQRGSAFAKDEDEDGEHEDDGAPAANLDGQLDDGLAER